MGSQEFPSLTYWKETPVSLDLATPQRLTAVSAAMSGASTPAAPSSGVGAAPAAAASPELSTLPEEVRSAYDYLPATLAGNLAGVLVVTWLFWPTTPVAVMLTWLAAFGVMWLGRALLAYRFRLAAPESLAQWARWRLLANAGTLAAGLLWGITAWVFYFRGGSIQQTGLVITVYTYCIAAVPVLATQPRVYLVFCALCFGPMIARIASSGQSESLQLAGILVLIFTLTSVLAGRYRQALSRAIDLKLRADELGQQLKIEKQEADAARHQAELANRAKTQFFTAASHDLRQPLHAMGLFAEALRQKSHSEDVSHLVNSINGSVDALEELFSELLDITRIDSGGVDVTPQHFEVGDLYRKLKLHFEPTAFEKGLSLRFRGGGHAVYADSLVVERILRNLVSNAIRYTNEGSVLVSARRRGKSVVLQVWDTGLGIRESEQARIFEEFYQVPNTPRVNAQQRKGLGLGLAIVKRLSDLMEAPLALRSSSGVGTVFSLTLPQGRVVPVPMPLVPARGPVNLTLAGRRIVIVEDEPAVLCGLEVLLQGWGATVTSFDSVRDVTAWAQSYAPAEPAPDLLIVDYRLEEGLTGIDALAALRTRFGAGIPAIVVTGSTMTGHDREAHELGFHLLIKPVVPTKLRAMIAFKLGVTGATPATAASVPAAVVPPLR